MHPRADRRRHLLGLAGSVLLAGCAGLPPRDLKAPTLQFAALEVADVTSREVRLVVTVDATNPNTVDIPLHNLRFDLDLLKQPFAAGSTTTTSVVMPAGLTTQVPIDFRIPTMRLVELILKARTVDPGSIGYQVRGSANWGANGINLPFDRQGTLDLRKMLSPRSGPR